jgi:post-segregation antitoxin (ccd killing protein)
LTSRVNDPQILRVHIAHAMRNEAVLRFLEGNAESIAPEHDRDN